MRFLFLFFTLLQLNAVAQEYLEGKMERDGQSTVVLYDRTQFAITSKLHRTVYKIVDQEKRPLFTITLAHDKTNSEVNLSVSGGGEKEIKRFNYSKPSDGEIISAPALSGSQSASYDHLISIPDASNYYPILHQ